MPAHVTFVPFSKSGQKKCAQKCSVGERHRFMMPVVPEGTMIRIRFVKGGLMYANLCAKTKKPAWVHSLDRKYVEPKAVAPSYGSQVNATATRTTRDLSFSGLVGKLTAVEMARRSAVLQAARAG